MNMCRVTMTIPQTNVENHFPISIQTWLIPDMDDSWQNFTDLESVLVHVGDFEQHLDLIMQRLTMDGFIDVTCSSGGNNRRIHAQRPPYMSQRGLRMYVRQWLNTFDEVEIWKEKEGLINE